MSDVSNDSTTDTPAAADEEVALAPAVAADPVEDAPAGRRGRGRASQSPVEGSESTPAPVDQDGPEEPSALRIGEGGTPFVGIARLRFHPAIVPGVPMWFVGVEADALVAKGNIVVVPGA